MALMGLGAATCGTGRRRAAHPRGQGRPLPDDRQGKPPNPPRPGHGRPGGHRRRLRGSLLGRGRARATAAGSAAPYAPPPSAAPTVAGASSSAIPASCTSSRLASTGDATYRIGNCSGAVGLNGGTRKLYKKNEISCKSGISASSLGWLLDFSGEAGFVAPIPGLWKDVVLFRDMPGGEVA